MEIKATRETGKVSHCLLAPFHDQAYLNAAIRQQLIEEVVKSSSGHVTKEVCGVIVVAMKLYIS